MRPGHAPSPLSARRATVPAELRLFSHFFNRPDPGADCSVMAALAADSLEVLTNCFVEPILAIAPVGEAMQFERTGYFCADPDGTRERPVFNRTVGLRDSYAKAK